MTGWGGATRHFRSRPVWESRLARSPVRGRASAGLLPFGIEALEQPDFAEIGAKTASQDGRRGPRLVPHLLLLFRRDPRRPAAGPRSRACGHSASYLRSGGASHLPGVPACRHTPVGNEDCTSGDGLFGLFWFVWRESSLQQERVGLLHRTDTFFARTVLAEAGSASASASSGCPALSSWCKQQRNVGVRALRARSIPPLSGDACACSGTS